MGREDRSYLVSSGSGATALASSLPPGAEPKSFRVDEVTELLKRAAYLPLFSMANPEEPDVPISPWPFSLVPPLRDAILFGMLVNEAPHRFEVGVEEATQNNGLAASHVVREQVASIHVHFAITPKDFEAGPGRVPPSTLLIPFISQRFSFPRGEFLFLDSQRSGFRGFGAGHTFPIRLRGKLHLRIGAVIEILEGLGKLSGFQGAVVVNGEITPPNELALFMMPRLIDPNGVLEAGSAITTAAPVPDPDPTTAFLFFLAEPDPARPISVNRAGDGRILGVNLFERLKIAHISFDVSTPQGIRSKTREGDIVGHHSSTLVFNPQPSTDVTPLYSSNDVYTFHGKDGKEVGTLKANLEEGRAIRTRIEGGPSQIFRVGGAGPFLEGTGQFVGAIGMASVNGIMSVNPCTVSSLYMLRIIDPDGRFRIAAEKAWS